tara:strand:- start:575 stop:721 length:147 start_codon:yes stop_codon:yes gene_type:complete
MGLEQDYIDWCEHECQRYQEKTARNRNIQEELERLDKSSKDFFNLLNK